MVVVVVVVVIVVVVVVVVSCFFVSQRRMVEMNANKYYDDRKGKNENARGGPIRTPNLMASVSYTHLTLPTIYSV